MIFLTVLILSFLLQLVLPWWIVVVISFATCGLISKTAKISLWQPFFAILLLWGGMAFYKSYLNEHLLAGKIAITFGLSAWWQILIATALVAAFVSGVSGLCGFHFRKAVLALKNKQ